MSKLRDFALTLAARLDNSFVKTFSNASGKIDKLSEAVKKAERSKQALDKIMSQSRATLEASQNFAKLKEKLVQVSAQMKATNAPSAKLKAEYNQTRIAVSQACEKLEEQRAVLSKLKVEYGATGKSLKQLAQDNEALAQASAKAQAQQAQVQKFKQFQSNVSSKRTDFGMQFGIGAAQMLAVKGVADMFTAPIKLGMDFDKTMSRVGAVSGATGEDLKKLRDTAIDLGASTVFSGSQAAEGMTYLAMSGFKTNDIISAMPGLLSLAAAGQIELGQASDITGSMISSFGLKSSDSAHVADVLANTFTNTATDLAGLGETMKYAGPIASSLGVSLEEAAAMAGKLGDNGIRGSEAGTALRAVMTRLVAPSTAGAKALYALGVNVKDAQGNVRAMPDILKDLGEAMQKLPESAQVAINADIFGQEALGAANILQKNAVSGVLQDMLKTVSKVGTADQVAAKQTDNFVGDIEQLGGAYETLQQIISDAVAPALRKLTQAFADGVGTVAKFFKEHQNLLKILMAVGAGVGAIVASLATFNLVVGGAGYVVLSVIGGFLKLVQVFKLLQSAFIALTVVMRSSPLGMIITSISLAIAAGIALYKNWDLIKAKAEVLWDWFSEKFPRIATFIKSALEIGGIWIDKIKYNFSQLIDFVSNVFVGEWGLAWENVKNIFVNIFSTLADIIKLPINGVIGMINKAFASIGSIGISIPDWVPGMGGKKYSFELPQIPMLANGGIATSPTLAMIGEGADNEAIIPLSKLEQMLSKSSGNANVQVTFSPVINVTVSGQSEADPYAQIKKALSEGQQDFARQMNAYFSERSRLSYE